MIRIHDVETNEIIDREMTADELKDHEANVAALETLKKVHAEKVAKKAALLDKLGITADEAALLLG